MKKILLLALLLTFSNGDNYWDAEDNKPYFEQRDNKAHIIALGAYSAIATHITMEYYSFTKTEAWLFSVGTSILIGAAKESTDKNFDMNDLGSSALGGVFGASIVVYTF